MKARVITPVVLAAVVGLNVGGQAQSPRLSRNELVATAAAYVRAYQQEFAFLIADEHTVQESFGVKAVLRVPLKKRTTRGEIFITFLEGRRHWTTVRDVAEVEGVPVVDRVDLPGLLSREDPDTVAKRLWASNARYNIGGVIRNFNDPMLALLVLSEAHRSRFSFDVENTDRTDAAGLATLSFRERERPTLVRPESGGAVYARGTISIDASTGTVHDTRFTVRYDNIEAQLETEFSRDAHVGLWVPVKFSERYTAGADGLRDEITVISTYSNYRRFEARSRLIDTRPMMP